LHRSSAPSSSSSWAAMAAFSASSQACKRCPTNGCHTIICNRFYNALHFLTSHTLLWCRLCPHKKESPTFVLLLHRFTLYLISHIFLMQEVTLRFGSHLVYCVRANDFPHLNKTHSLPILGLKCRNVYFLSVSAQTTSPALAPCFLQNTNDTRKL